MKISKVVRDLHAECSAVYGRLATQVGERLKPQVEQRGWFYLARIKQLESYALKLETGRIGNPRQPEDFFACTIIVRTLGEIAEAEALVQSMYGLVQRRPGDDELTHKAPSSFIFDDLRLYVAQPASSTGRDLDLDGLCFEVQIKTILQHAWSVATHDLIYKSDTASWPKERIAFQVKAMLEHAELAIAEAEQLAEASAVARTDKRTKEAVSLIQSITSIWPPDQLPVDLKRLAESVRELLRCCELQPDAYEDVIATERARIGVLPSDLSPYAFTLQAIAHRPELEFQRKFLNRRTRTSVFVHGGMDLPAWMLDPHERIIRL